MTTKVSSPSELAPIAQAILKSKSPLLLLGLSGDLGTGKTTFTQIFAKELGVTQDIISPTFILQREYEIVGDSRYTKLFHIDLYRIDTPGELMELEMQKLFIPGNCIVVEWVDKFNRYFADWVEQSKADAWFINFEHESETSRLVAITHENSRN